MRNYDAGNYDRGNANWRVLNQSAEFTDRYSRDNVRARARDLERNSDMMNSVIGVLIQPIYLSQISSVFMRSCLLMKSAAHPVHCKVHMMLTILYIRIRSITVTILSCTRVITLLRHSIKYAIFCQNMQKASTAMPALRATTRSTLL